MSRLLFPVPQLALSMVLVVLPTAGARQPGWSLTEVEGATAASYAGETGETLVSAGCDADTGDMVFFVMSAPEAANKNQTASENRERRLTIVTSMGRLNGTAEPASDGDPGYVARFRADTALVEALANQATVTFQLAEVASEENPAAPAAGGLAVPIGPELRQVVEDCG